MFPNIHNFPVISADTEATGLRYPTDMAFAAGIASDEGAWAWDFRRTPAALEWLARELPKYEGEIVFHNASFDVKMLSTVGVGVNLANVRDTVVKACCINEHEGTIFPWTRGRAGGYSLDYLANKYCDVRKDQQFYVEAKAWLEATQHTPRSNYWTNKKIMENIAILPWEIVEPYLLQDCVATHILNSWQEKEIEAQGIQKIVAFEHSVMPTIIRAEMRGINIHISRTEEAIDKLDVIVKQKQKELDDEIGTPFNVNSSPQVKELFKPYEQDGEWFACDGTPLETTGSGGPSFGGSALRDISLPVSSRIVELRSLMKTRDTFLGGHILGHQVNGVVYPNINQSKGEDGGTGTGRLSYTDPAMQQIPSRNKQVASIVKPCFLPPDGMVWVEPDLQSFEVRVFAHLVAAYNTSIAEAYAIDPKMDFHNYVGKLTGLPRNATYSGEANAKQLNLSMIFNQGNGQTADTMGMSWSWAEFTDKSGKVVRYKKAGKEAMAVIDTYHRNVQGVKLLADRAKAVAEARGYIFTSAGRRLRFPRGYKSYKASGLLIQSTSADINKRNWIKIEEALGEEGHLILNTHDSYSLACPEDWRPAFNRVKEAIEDVSDIGLRVPLILELDGAGYDWWQAKTGFMK